MLAKKSSTSVQKISRANNFAEGSWETLSCFVELLQEGTASSREEYNGE